MMHRHTAHYNIAIAINMGKDLHKAVDEIIDSAEAEIKNLSRRISTMQTQNAEILRTLRLLDSLSAMDRQTAIDGMIKVLEDA